MNLISIVRRVPAWAVLGAVGTSLLGIGIGIDVAADDTPPAVVLNGQGDSDLIGRIVTFQDALFEADQPTDLSYFNVGSAQGRKNLLNGKADFIFSGVPFTSAELATRAAGAGEIIDVPVSAVALAVLVTTPPQVGWGTFQEPTDPSCGTEDEIPELCVPVEGTFTGPFRVPADNLSALIMGLPTTATNNLVAWANPAWASALGTSAMRIQFERLRGHTWINRSESSSQNSALLTYAAAMSPEVWTARVTLDSAFDWQPGGERMSPNTKPTRQGTDQVAGAITFSSLNPRDNTGWGTGFWTGNAGAVPVTYVGDLKEDFPAAGLKVMEVQNKHGDWVLPTKESIEAALAADPTGMAVGATDDIAGAYPLVYLNRLYTVAGTLSADEANALAALVRYMATDGQDVLVANGGAALPAALRSEALAAADEIVVANCTEAAYQVTTSGPGPFEPTSPKVQELTSMKHCTLVPAPATTTTTSTTTTTTTIAETTTTAAAATTTTTTDATTTTTSESTTSVATTIVASQSPTVSPGSGSSGSVYIPSASPNVTLPAISSDDGGADGDEEVTEETTAEDAASAPDDELAEAVVTEETTTTAIVAGATGGPGTRPRGVALTALPMVMPDDGAADYKKLGTLFLGAALFLLGRRSISARRLVLT